MGEVNPDIMNEKEPPNSFWDEDLVTRAAMRVLAGEPMPLPDQVADMPSLWETDVNRQVMAVRRQQAYIQAEREAEREAQKEAEKYKRQDKSRVRRGR